jgi:septum formation protein
MPSSVGSGPRCWNGRNCDDDDGRRPSGSVTRVVLGSASPGRLKVLRQAGIDPIVVVSGVDEDRVTAALGPRASPEELACALAEAKADRVVGSLDPAVTADCVVIGCDSMLYLDGDLRGKPRSTEVARRAWQQMAGSAGQLYTGHCVIRLTDGVVVHRETEAAVTVVRFGHPTPADLDAYLKSGEPLRVAGGFTLDGLGGWFIDGVDGDPSNVVGIGLTLMRALFARSGLSIETLWSANPVG